MSRKIEFFEEVRGKTVLVTAEDFDGDLSVGIQIGPGQVYATDEDGMPFDLTDEETEKFGIQATETYLNDDDY